MACRVGAQGQVNWAKNEKTYPNYDVTHKKTNPKLKNVC